MRLIVAILASLIVAGTADIELEGGRTTLAQYGATDCRTFLPYSPDPDHIWNRLQRALIVRTGPDGSLWGCDEVDPLLWFDTKYVLTGERHTGAMQALDEFIETHAERLVSDPLKRALLQRNLWAVFLWLTRGETFKAQRERLEQRIATVMTSIALTPEEIVRLPGNFSVDAEAAGGLELPAVDRGWALISRDDRNPAAPIHAAALPRSVFLVYLRMPAGTNADTYIEEWRRFSRTHTDDRCDEHPCFPPQLPVGTDVALVRRAMLIDTAARPRVSPLTESVQLRRYAAVDPSMPVFVRRPADQLRAEFRLSQRALLKGESSLRVVGPDESDFPQFATQGQDWFEEREAPLVRAFTRQKPYGPTTNTLQSCVPCHSGPGVMSFTTYSRSHVVAPGEPMFVSIHRGDAGQEIAKQLEALLRDPSWRKLQPLMAPLR